MTGHSLQGQLAQIQAAITELESQCSTLGDVAVDTSIAAQRARMAALSGQEGSAQRKLVAVLFCDLADFTPLFEKMDPDDVREVLDTCFQPWQDCITRNGGRLEKSISDAIMAVFGVPVAKEVDAEHAIKAALHVPDRVRDSTARPRSGFGISRALRAGIHTGKVLGGQAGDPDGLVVTAASVRLASRLENLTPRISILRSRDTYRHVRGVFHVQEQEPVRVKGKSEPVVSYAVRPLGAPGLPIHLPGGAGSRGSRELGLVPCPAPRTFGQDPRRCSEALVPGEPPRQWGGSAAGCVQRPERLARGVLRPAVPEQLRDGYLALPARRH